MKKIFTLSHPKKKYARLVDSVRRDIKRYLKRERSKDMPEGFDTWLFDCRFGSSPEDAKKVDVESLGKHIATAEKQQRDTFYIEILAKPGHRNTPAESD